jgi:hypothetical protein
VTALATIRLGLIAAPGAAAELAERLADELPAALDADVSGDVEWSVPVVAHDLADGPTASGIEMIDAARARMLRVAVREAAYGYRPERDTERDASPAG